jgi:hypothetical protein
VSLNIAGMSKLFLPARHRRVCFINPINGRRWLSLLEPHQRYGLLFKRNLHYPEDALGFSFSSNEHGLRGPANPTAPGVILGTSFAMGLSVDDGDNWYELLLEEDQWFNAGMPVGPRNHANLLDDVYRGSYETLLYVYHPNIWKTAQGYVKAEESGQDIFQTLSWKTALWRTVALYPKWLAKELYKTNQGWSVHRKWNGSDFYFNARYSYMELGKHLPLAESQMAILNDVFRRFERVIAVRAPIKEDLAGRQGMSDRLRTLAAHNDEWWTFFASNAVSGVRTVEPPADAFDASDFHPYDTHWTATGNEKFARLVRPVLLEAGVGGVKN